MLMNNAVLRKTIENVRTRRDIKIFITERKGNYLVPEPNHHTKNFFTENLLAIKMKSTEILMNELVYSGLSILEFSKILMHLV